MQNLTRFRGSFVTKLNDKVMSYDPNMPIERNPDRCKGLSSIYMAMGQQLHSIGGMRLNVRRAKLKEQLYGEFLTEMEELGEVDVGFINTQP